MYRLYVKRKGKIITEFYRSGNVDAYYKFSQLFHDAEVGDVVYLQEEESGTIILRDRGGTYRPGMGKYVQVICKT